MNRLRTGRRYLALIAAIAVFAAGLAVALWQERADQVARHERYRGDLWAVVQTEYEFHRLEAALAGYGLGDGSVTADDLRLRFDILWSRIRILLDAPSLMLLDDVASKIESLRALDGALSNLEPVLADFQSGDAATYRRFRDTLAPFADPLHDISLAQSYAESSVDDAVRADGTHGLMIASLLGMGVSAAAFLLLLIRERRAVARALATVQAAQAREVDASRRLLDAVDVFPGGFAIYDADDRLVLTNERYRNFHPATNGIRVGMTFAEIMQELAATGIVRETIVDVDAWIAERMRLHRASDSTVEYRLTDGRWTRVRTLATSEGGRVTLVFDMSEAKAREAALASLAERNAQFAAAIAAMPVGVVIADATRPGRPLVFANPAFRALTGFDDADLEDRGVDLLWATDADPDSLATLDRLIDGGRAGQVELLNVRKDGTQWWNRLRVAPVLDGDGALTHMVGLSVDITQSRQSEAALRASEERFRSLAESIAAAIVVWDDAGRIQFSNPGAERMFGHPSFAMAGRPVAMLVPPRDRDRGDELPPSAYTEAAGGEKHKTVLRADGTELAVDCTLASWQGLGGRLHAAFIQDVSDRLRAERERDEMAEQFHQAQKMEAIGTLAGGVAHDFNNILAIMLGHAELLRMDADRDTAAARQLEEILTAGHRATDLVRQLLTLSRNYEREAVPVRLAEIARETQGLLRATLPTSIELDLRVDSETAVLADATQMHQVLMNLCVNAQHAIASAPGRIDVAVEDVTITGDSPPSLVPAGAAPATARLVLGTLAPGPYVRLAVSDSGCGMNDATLARAFDPFFSTKPRDRGTGLGLAAVRGIVLAHEGAVAVETIIGMGTWVAIYLPRHGGEAAAANTADAPPAPGVGRILLVDDEEAVARVAAEGLRRAGYQVDVATDPLAALALVRARPDGWDLVVSDQTMPRLPGIELAEQMRRIRPDLPVVLCTGYSESVTEETARAAGIDEFLMKPVRANALAAAVARALERRGAPGARAA